MRKPGKGGGQVEVHEPHDDARAILDALREYVMETDRYVDERGGAAGLHRTDLDALTHVLGAARSGVTMTPGALSDLLRLSPPATSALLGRLEQVGHVSRSHSATDRRRVQIEVNQQALDVADGVFRPLGAAMGRVIAGFDAAEQALVLRFLVEAVAATREARTQAADPDPEPDPGRSA